MDSHRPGVTAFVHVGLVVEVFDETDRFLALLGLDCGERGAHAAERLLLSRCDERVVTPAPGDRRGRRAAAKGLRTPLPSPAPRQPHPREVAGVDSVMA